MEDIKAAEKTKKFSQIFHNIPCVVVGLIAIGLLTILMVAGATGITDPINPFKQKGRVRGAVFERVEQEGKKAKLKPVADAKVYLYKKSDLKNPILSMASGPNGNFNSEDYGYLISKEEAGTEFQIYAEKGNLKSQKVNFTAKLGKFGIIDTELELVLGQGGEETAPPGEGEDFKCEW